MRSISGKGAAPLAWVVVASLFLILVQCGSSTQSCPHAGLTRACTCADGSKGEQTCEADLTPGPCSCGGSSSGTGTGCATCGTPAQCASWSLSGSSWCTCYAADTTLFQSDVSYYRSATFTMVSSCDGALPCCCAGGVSCTCNPIPLTVSLTGMASQEFTTCSSLCDYLGGAGAGIAGLAGSGDGTLATSCSTSSL